MSAKEKQKVVEVLKELNEFVHDGLEGYERAAQESKDQLRQDIYRKFSQQRLAFANEINMIIQRYGGSPERDTTAKGKLYRQWMDFKAALTGFSESAILGSNIHGEEWAQKAYRDALDHELPSDVRGTILRQREASTDVLNRLHELRDNAKSTAAGSSKSGSGSSSTSTIKTALYAAGAAAGAALVYGLVTKKIPTNRLFASIEKAKEKLTDKPNNITASNRNNKANK